MDTEIRELERQARAGDAESLKKLQRHRERTGFGPADAEYLHKYIEMCEQFIKGSANLQELEGPDMDRLRDECWDEVYTELEEAGEDPDRLWDDDQDERRKQMDVKVEARVQERLKEYEPSKLQELNEEYKYLVCPKTLKTEILARKLAGYYDSEGWAISSIC